MKTGGTWVRVNSSIAGCVSSLDTDSHTSRLLAALNAVGRPDGALYHDQRVTISADGCNQGQPSLAIVKPALDRMPSKFLAKSSKFCFRLSLPVNAVPALSNALSSVAVLNFFSLVFRLSRLCGGCSSNLRKRASNFYLFTFMDPQRCVTLHLAPRISNPFPNSPALLRTRLSVGKRKCRWKPSRAPWEFFRPVKAQSVSGKASRFHEGWVAKLPCQTQTGGVDIPESEFEAQAMSAEMLPRFW